MSKKEEKEMKDVITTEEYDTEEHDVGEHDTVKNIDGKKTKSKVREDDFLSGTINVICANARKTMQRNATVVGMLKQGTVVKYKPVNKDWVVINDGTYCYAKFITPSVNEM